MLGWLQLPPLEHRVDVRNIFIASRASRGRAKIHPLRACAPIGRAPSPLHEYEQREHKSSLFVYQLQLRQVLVLTTAGIDRILSFIGLGRFCLRLVYLGIPLYKLSVQLQVTSGRNVAFHWHAIK